MNLTFVAKALAATESENERVLILEEFRTHIVSSCIQAIDEVKEPEGAMPPANVEAQNKNPELAARVMVRLTKREAIENIMKIKWERP